MAQNDDWWKTGGTPVEDSTGSDWWKSGGTPVDPPKPRTRGVFETVNDAVIEGANAAAGGVASLANMIRPGNAVSSFIDENIIKAGEAKQSDVVQGAKRKLSEGLQNAKGIGDEFSAVGGYAWDNPLLAASQAVGSFAVPGAAAKVLGRVGGIGAGAALAGGDAAGTAYELSSKAGATDEQALAAGRGASVIPALVGGVTGAFGAEKLLAGGKGFNGGLVSRALKTGASEAGQEAFEEGVTQYEGQRAATPYDATIDPAKGVAGAAGMGAIMGGATGAGVSLMTGNRDAAPIVKPSQAMGIDPAAGPLSRAAATAVDAGVSQSSTPQVQTAGVEGATVQQPTPGLSPEGQTLSPDPATQAQTLDKSGLSNGEGLVPSSDFMPAASAQQADPLAAAPLAPAPEQLQLGARSLDELRQSLRNDQDPAIRKTVAAEIRRRRESMPDPLSQPQQGITLEPQAAETQQEQPKESSPPAAEPAAAIEPVTLAQPTEEQPNVSTTPDVLRNGSNGSSGAGPNLSNAGMANDVGVPDGTAGANAPVVSEPVQSSAGEQPASGQAALRPERWRQNALQAGRVARTLGLDPKGKRLAQIVAEIDAKDSAPTDAPNNVISLTDRLRDKIRDSAMEKATRQEIESQLAELSTLGQQSRVTMDDLSRLQEITANNSDRYNASRDLHQLLKTIRTRAAGNIQTETPANVQNAPQAANDGQAKAAPVEASTAARGDAATNGAVSAAGQDAGVRADGVDDLGPDTFAGSIKREMEARAAKDAGKAKARNPSRPAKTQPESVDSEVYRATSDGAGKFTLESDESTIAGNGDATPRKFASESDALAWAKENGFKTAEQVAKAPAEPVNPEPPAKKVDRAASLRKAEWKKNPLRSFLGQHGLSLDLAKEFAPGITERRKAMVGGYGPIFRKAGKNLDLLAEIAREEGFISADQDATDLYELVAAVFRGERVAPMFTADAAQDEMQARMDAMQEQAAADFEDFIGMQAADPFGPLSDDEIAATGYDAADEKIKAEVDALIAMADSLGIDTETIREDAARETAEQSEQVYYVQARRILTQAIAQSTGSSGNNQAVESRQGRREEAKPRSNADRGTGAGSTGEQSGLTAPTRRDIEAQQARTEQADKLDARAQVKRESEAGDTSFMTGFSGDGRQDTTGDIFGGVTQAELEPVRQSIESMRRELIDLENKIVGAAGMAPGFIEDAIRSRKVPAQLKQQRDALREKMREERERVQAAQPKAEKPAEDAQFSVADGGVTESEAFKKWFGDSKVVDADGRPLVVFHGTASDFGTFIPSKATDKEGRKLRMGWGNKKFYFTTEPSAASSAAKWAATSKDRPGSAPNVMPVFLRVRNPIAAPAYMDMVRGYEAEGKSRDEAITSADRLLKDRGIDGIVDPETGGIAVFLPEQIKSATGNRGTFDAENPDIRLDAATGDSTQTTYTPASDAQQKAVTAFADRLSKNRDSFVLMDAVKPSGARQQEAQTVANLAKTMFGREAVFVKFKGRPLFNGAVSTTDPGKIFVNIESARPMMAVLGHELLHELRKSNPAAYNQLAKTLKTVTKDDYIYEALLKKKYREQGLNWTPQDISEELYGDIVGDNFMDPKFWEAIAGDKPIFAKQLYRAVMNWLDKIASMFKRVKVRSDGSMVLTLAEQADGSRPFGTQKYLQDIEAARAAVAQAMGQFKQGGQGKDAMAIADRQNQTETPAFLKWFGDSKVVDSAGKPLVVYHGTSRGGFSKFSNSDRSRAEGFVFTDSRPMARTYTPGDNDLRGGEGENRAGIYPVYLSLKNVKEIDWGGDYFQKDDGTDTNEVIAKAKAEGYDGVVIRNVNDPGGFADISAKRGGVGREAKGSLFIAFRPEQIKSATGNSGTFDPKNPDIRFSIADAVEQISPKAAVKPVVQFLNDTFKVRGKLHWWHKTVGTPFNLAERVPEFKRVFNAVQDFITSVSFYGAEAAAMAPKIIPKLESWKDLGKSPISAADNKAIASPIFEGTLSWRRGSNGKPVLADSVEEAGIVWTDDELRSKFLLTDEQVGLYREFRAATDKSLTGLALSDMLQFAGDDAKPIRDVVMGMSLKEGSETLSKYLKSLAAGEEKTRKGILLDTANTVMDRADKAQSLIDRGYAPLQRFGRHTIYARNAKGEQLFFGMYEDRWAAGRAARQMREQYPDATVEVGMMSEQSYKMFQGISPETLELFGTMLGMDANADGESNKAFQMYLKLAKSNRSALKRMIERKGISGYSEDASRVLASFIYSNARQTSTNLHVGDIMNSVNDIPRDMGDAKDAAMKLARYTMDPQEEAKALRGLLFAQYLGGSIASAAINALQPAQVTFPYLSQFVGAKRSAVLMGGAVKDALKKTTGDAKLDAELKKAEEEGIVSPQEIFQLMAQAQGKATLKAGDGTKAGDAAAAASNTLSRLSLGWGKVFSIPEQFNRRTTFIAAYRTALETGEANPYDFAKQAVKETQLVYNKGNRPEWARGTVGALAFTFKTYSISYVELLQRMSANGPEGRRAAMLMIATLMLMAGAGGLPGIEDAENVVDGIAQRVFGLNFQSRQKRQEWLAEVFGEGGARFIENGLSGLPWSPTDVSGRLGLGNLIPGTGVFVKKQDYSRDIAEIAGPAADMTKRFLQGAGLLLQGEVLKAGEIVAPAAVRNMIQGARMAATDQYADTKGRKVIDTTPAEALTKFIGFQPADVARVQESTGTIQQMIALNKIRESEIADKWAKGLASKDQDQIQEARDELLKWNRANPDSPIRINMSQIFKRVKALNEDKATRIARTAPKEIRQDVRRELESNQ